ELARLFGVRRVTVLHTRDRATAERDAFVEPLRRVRGVWLSSGNAGRLIDAYLDTRVQRELEALLARGGVVGGNSAGAIIQGSFVIRGRADKPVLVARGRERGFGFLRNVAVDPHLLSQKREAELVTVVDAHPELLGIGLADSVAIEVRGDRFRAIGEGQVVIFDDRKHGCCWYYPLPAGAEFDLRARAVVGR
ncbi:MAG TPA: Type 1 glutamine amidotransferase-like domain-containing protein, partial [Gemmatimonadaceae bacterium]|nr:Type 1 glutamine amidotransferase-like domain-containing protein [Gemmatimonadaceae bacterium]